MRVEQIMTRSPLTCDVSEHAGKALWRMWEADCGILPVMNGSRLVGVVTDRDIALATALRGRKPEDILVGDLHRGRPAPFVCKPRNDVRDALRAMREHCVRRLPVVEDGRLVGILSMNDLMLAAAATAGDEGRPTYGEIVRTLQSICAHRVRQKAETRDWRRAHIETQRWWSDRLVEAEQGRDER